MSDDTVLSKMNDMAIHDDYLYSLLKKLQIHVGLKKLGLETESLENEEFFDLLRFSDILCHSNESLNKNISLKIIADLYDDVYKLFSKNVLTKLGNFLSIKYISDAGNNIENIEIDSETLVKETFQKIGNDKILTDVQYDLFKKLQHNDIFSYSAPTSSESHLC